MNNNRNKKTGKEEVGKNKKLVHCDMYIYIDLYIYIYRFESFVLLRRSIY